jgi:hypothetical protein
MEKHSKTPANCESHYFNLTDIGNITLEYQIRNAFPYIKSVQEPEALLQEYPQPLITVLCSIQIIGLTILMVFLIKNSAVYGISQHRFCQGYLLASFYLFSIILTVAFFIQSSMAISSNNAFMRFDKEVGYSELDAG